MKFIADLHVHSKFSRATAKNLDLEHLYIAAQLKGITLVGTGDFTYPQWFEEIQEKLLPDDAGLFRMKDDLANECDRQVPRSCRGDVRFILTTEISNIYKKNGKTRKNHNLVLVPDLDTAERFNAKLDKIGNIKSDGRPILGLDARDLLETLLETSDQASLIPAHIWTPWFSMLGSKSGFDSVEECFDDLTSHIFAVETGLSSDPPMNWRVSGLDGLTLVSNSDAHSPLNLGREANLFDTELSYAALKAALQSGDSGHFLGTFEFYPEEGKYHLDGHRNCKVQLWPEKTMQHEGICPECGKALTLGVLHRVEKLADRPDGHKPELHHPYYSIIPLLDILSEIFRVGTKSKKVGRAYNGALDKLGPELNILHHLGPQDIDAAGIPLLSEAVHRMRQKKIAVDPGYDGEYGQVKIFSQYERRQALGQQSLFSVPSMDTPIEQRPVAKKAVSNQATMPEVDDHPRVAQQNLKIPGQVDKIVGQLNEEQRRAVEYPSGPLMIVAGPGTGKTRTLTHRIAYLIHRKRISPQNILAVTFTHKASEEMRQRLQRLLGDNHQLPLVATFHALCLNILTELNPTGKEMVLDDDNRKKLVSDALTIVAQKGVMVSLKAHAVLTRIMEAKQNLMDPAELLGDSDGQSDSDARCFFEVYRTYQELLSIQGLNDYEDLIFKVVRRFEADETVCRQYRDRFKHIFVDEYQDLNHGQYRIIRALSPAGSTSHDICVIGDPDQSIYGFRGSDTKYFSQFVHDYPGAGVIRLTRNYRSTETILDASYQVISAHREPSSNSRTYSQIEGIKTISILELFSEKSEAEAIARIIENLVGGTGFHSLDTRKIADANLSKASSYSDFAVLYRTHDQHRRLATTFENAGIPFQIVSRKDTLNHPGLAELISYLKVVENFGNYGDFEKIMRYFEPGVAKNTLSVFKRWCFQNRFSLRQGMRKARQFPVPGLTTVNQQRLIDFFDNLRDRAKNMSTMAVADKLIYLVESSKLSAKIEADAKAAQALEVLVEMAKRFDRRTSEFVRALALHTDTDAYAPRAEKVSLMTMHAAKGLEFSVVFIAGCEQGYLPFERSPHDPADIEEERRLFYVAMTRAMRRLYFTRAKKRRIYGQLESRALSPFVADIETRLREDVSPRLKKKQKKTDQKQMTLF